MNPSQLIPQQQHRHRKHHCTSTNYLNVVCNGTNQKLLWGATTTNYYVVCKPARNSTWSRATFEEQVEQQYKEKNTGGSLTLLSVFMEKVAKINLSSDIQCNISKINLSSYIQCNISRQTQKIQNMILKASAMKCINNLVKVIRPCTLWIVGMLSQIQTNTIISG